MQPPAATPMLIKLIQTTSCISDVTFTHTQNNSISCEIAKALLQCQHCLSPQASNAAVASSVM
jgi:hypothetical protein